MLDRYPEQYQFGQRNAFVGIFPRRPGRPRTKHGFPTVQCTSVLAMDRQRPVPFHREASSRQGHAAIVARLTLSLGHLHRGCHHLLG